MPSPPTQITLEPRNGGVFLTLSRLDAFDEVSGWLTRAEARELIDKLNLAVPAERRKAERRAHVL